MKEFRSFFKLRTRSDRRLNFPSEQSNFPTDVINILYMRRKMNSAVSDTRLGSINQPKSCDEVYYVAKKVTLSRASERARSGISAVSICQSRHKITAKKREETSLPKKDGIESDEPDRRGMTRGTASGRSSFGALINLLKYLLYICSSSGV